MNVPSRMFDFHSRRSIKRLIARADHRVGRSLGRRVLFDLRNEMNLAVLQPMISGLLRDGRVRVSFSCERPAKVSAAVKRAVESADVLDHGAVRWRRWDLYVSADPWTRPRLRRCARSANFFHGVAGKSDLDNPAARPIGFDWFDRVGFVNQERMDTYVGSGIVSPEAAVLIGFPKIDCLVLRASDGASIKRRLGVDPYRPTVLYAPTWSPASSLHLAGEHIVANLRSCGFNVIIKLHPVSLDPLPKYSGGIDWRSRMRRIEEPGRIVYVEEPDSTPLMAASDALVTDHSTVGFEYCLLDRPILLFDAPDLAKTSRINPVQIERLRSVGHVVSSAAEIGRAALAALGDARSLSPQRAALAARMFHRPGTATTRAMATLYDLLQLAPPSIGHTESAAGTAMTVGDRQPGAAARSESAAAWGASAVRQRSASAPD